MKCVLEYLVYVLFQLFIIQQALEKWETSVYFHLILGYALQKIWVHLFLCFVPVLSIEKA